LNNDKNKVQVEEQKYLRPFQIQSSAPQKLRILVYMSVCLLDRYGRTSDFDFEKFAEQILFNATWDYVLPLFTYSALRNKNGE